MTGQELGECCFREKLEKLPLVAAKNVNNHIDWRISSRTPRYSLPARHFPFQSLLHSSSSAFVLQHPHHQTPPHRRKRDFFGRVPKEDWPASFPWLGRFSLPLFFYRFFLKLIPTLWITYTHTHIHTYIVRGTSAKSMTSQLDWDPSTRCRSAFLNYTSNTQSPVLTKSTDTSWRSAFNSILARGTNNSQRWLGKPRLPMVVENLAVGDSVAKNLVPARLENRLNDLCGTVTSGKSGCWCSS